MKKGTVYFFTGLSGAGKTTIGERFYNDLRKRKPNVVFLDGDMTRPIFCEDIGYGTEDRLRGGKRNFRIAKMLADQGIDVVCCYICMYTDIRNWNRENIENYKEIYIKVTRETLLKRNKKGLYTTGKNVVGVDIPFDEPQNSDVILFNDGEKAPEEMVAQLEKELGLD